MRQLRGIVLIASLTAAGCGSSEAERRAEEARIEAEKAQAEAEEAAEEASAAADSAGKDLEKGMADFAKAMEGMAGAFGAKTADGKAVEPISFRELQTVLPEVSGWTRGKPTGERMTSPVAFSEANARYTRDDADIEVKVVDSALHQMLIAPWTMFLTAGYEKETESGYEKSLTIGGHPGFEKWNEDGKGGEVNLVVAKRFLVTVEGNGIDDAAILHEFAEKLDTAKLASLK